MQYDFGIIDPYVDDGVTLADMLNNWRDANHSWHRGAARPSYAVPGMMWINDTGGPTSWLVNVYMGPGVGDIVLWAYDTTTGAFTFGNPSQLASAILLAQAATDPTVRWTATGNAADQKTWRALVQAAGLLRYEALTDAGAVAGSIEFRRDGTIRSATLPAADNSDALASTSWVRALLAASPSGPKTGDTLLTYRTVADAGWIVADDGTIGDAGSPATTRANADAQALFNLFWPNVNCAIAGGKGASAAADWGAKKALGLPKTLSRVLGVGGAAGAGLTARGVGDALGAESVMSGSDNSPAGINPQPAGWVFAQSPHQHSVNVMQPSAFLKMHIKL